VIEKMKSGFSDAFDIPELGLLTLSHNSKSLIVTSNKNNVPHVYQVLLSDPNKWIDLTVGGDRVARGSLSSDDSKFVFPRETAGNEKHNLFLTDMISYTTSLLLELESMRIAYLGWSTDDSSILFDFSSPTTMGLCRYFIAEKEVTIIYETNLMSWMWYVNPVKPLVPYVEQHPDNPVARDIKIIDYEKSEVIYTISEKDTSREFPLAWNQDGSKLIIVSNAKGEPSLAVWDVNSTELVYSSATELGLGIHYEIADWLPGTHEMIFPAKLNGHTRLYRENVFDSDAPVELPIEVGWISGLSSDNNNSDQIYLAWSNMANPTQIGRYNLSSGSFDPILDSRPLELQTKLSPGKFLHYDTFDDWKIPAFDVPPNPDVQLDGNPIIILIHGGPWWEFANNWETMGPVLQSYSNAGFRVFCPNIRGSTGYGNEFMLCNIGDLGGNDLKDVLTAQDYLSKKYPDCQKFFITGASYGGFMTLLILTKHPGIFDGGVAVVGITDWFEMHRLGDAVFKSFTEQFFNGPPEKNKDLYYDRSAINFVENMQEPLLIIHRANDSRCPVEPIYTFAGKAISLGKEVEIYVEQEAGHGQQKMEHLRKQYGMAIEFFKNLL
jgi:dipeptidyl aminopeptidase/acylaminoacyl peptidase